LSKVCHPQRFITASYADQHNPATFSDAARQILNLIKERLLQEDAQKGRPARPQPTNAPEAYPQGYVEDAFKVRTMLAAFFSILPAGA
jgi:hypothetical protein